MVTTSYKCIFVHVIICSSSFCHIICLAIDYCHCPCHDINFPYCHAPMSNAAMNLQHPHAVSFSRKSKNGFALRLALKQRPKGTRKWPTVRQKEGQEVHSCLFTLFLIPDISTSNASAFVSNYTFFTTSPYRHVIM